MSEPTKFTDGSALAHAKTPWRAARCWSRLGGREAPIPRPLPKVDAHASLVHELQVAFGAEVDARSFLQAALLSARLEALPERPEALIAFLEEHVRPTLEDELGEHLALAVLESLTRRHQRKVSGFRAAVPERASSAEPVRGRIVRVGLRPRALLCHEDRFARVSLARHLLGGGFDVDVVESFTDVTTLGGPPPRAAIVSARTSEVVVSAMVARFPALALVVLGVDLGERPTGPELVAAIGRLTVRAL